MDCMALYKWIGWLYFHGLGGSATMEYSFSLLEDKLDLLIECINNRKDYDLYGVTAYDGKMVRV